VPLQSMSRFFKFLPGKQILHPGSCRLSLSQSAVFRRRSFHRYQTGLWRSPGRKQVLYGVLNFVTLLNEAR